MLESEQAHDDRDNREVAHVARLLAVARAAQELADALRALGVADTDLPGLLPTPDGPWPDLLPWWGWLRRKSQQMVLARATDAAWIARKGIGMVFGPWILMLKSQPAGPELAQVEELRTTWLAAWAQEVDKEVRWHVERELGPAKELAAYTWLNLVTSRVTTELEKAVPGESNAIQELDRLERLAESFGTPMFCYLDWLEKVGQLVGFDREKYEQRRAFKMGDHRWAAMVNHLKRL
jgi:hypothetical protein